MYYRVRRSEDLTPIWVIIALNLAVFVATLIYQNLIYTLGMQPATILERPWTIITNMFTHAGLWHIFANMLTLYFFGRFLINLIGTRNMLITYFIGGIVANIFFILFALLVPAWLYNIAVGASGAIFALGGTLVILRPQLRVVAFPVPIPMPLWVAIVIGFLIMSIVPGIAWQAHLGGFICGLIAGLIMRKSTRGVFIA